MTEPRRSTVEGSDTGVRLSMRACGALRKPGQPVIILEAGLGVSGAHWGAVQRLLGDIPSYSYDRAGYGHSPPSERSRQATNISAELLDVLHTAEIHPPYIVVGHSYGGILAREFMAAAGYDAIHGAVLVDANQEDNYAKLRHPLAALKALTGGIDYTEAIGVARCDAFSVSEQADIALDESVVSAKTTLKREAECILQSAGVLGAKKQLDTQPLSMSPLTVIRGDASRDIERLLDHSSRVGRGTSSDLAQVREFLARFHAHDRDLQLQQLRLSCNSRFVQTEKSGHYVHAVEPELIAREISEIFRSIDCSELPCL
jgi:pimeloyl-ACP methyl ester carboxylesterase